MKKLTEAQTTELNRIWFIYGNNGKKHTHCNHRVIQNLIEHNEDTREFYLGSPKNDLSDECLEVIAKLLSTNS